MEIQLKTSGQQLKVTLKGFLDTMTSPQLEEKLDLSKITELVIDLKSVEYVSSAGLRVLLSFHKTMMAKGGKLIITNLTDSVKEIFDMVGYSAILNIK